MMSRMRQMSKFMFIFVGLAFIGLIVFEWGMDYSRGSRKDTTVGEVNGEKLTYTEYNELYKQLYQNERARNKGELDERTLSYLKSQVWDLFIKRVLFKEQMEKLHIAVTDSEIIYQIFNHPLPDLQQNPSFQTNGMFDINKYRQAITTADPKQQIALENYYRQQIPFSKLQNIITSTVRVSESEVKDEYERRYLKAKVDYLAILAVRFENGVEVSETDISDYYNNHIENFKEKEKRELEYVMFPLIPTADDTAALYKEVDKIKERLALGEDFNTLALEYSQDPSVQKNKGELGYFDRKTMVKPFSDAAFAAKPGDIIGPVKTIHGYHLIKVEDKKVENGIEKVKASHILLKITTGSSTMYAQEEKAKVFSDDAKSDGWDATVKKYGYETKTTGLFEKAMGYVPGFQGNPAIESFAFSGGEGDVSGTYTIDKGYVVFGIKTVQPEGYLSIDDETVKKRLTAGAKLEKAKAIAMEFASGLENQVKSGTPFKEIAEQNKEKVHYGTTNMFTIDQPVRGIGKYPAFSAMAFKLKVGERSGLIKGEEGFYYEHLLEKTAFDSSDYAAKKSSIKTRLLSTKRRMIFTDWYDKLKEEADITDNRAKFNIY